MMTTKLSYFEEPRVEFGYAQTAEDSRDGLTLFGPFEPAQGEARMGVIGTAKGLEAYKGFASEVNKPIFTASAGRPFFPGFHSAFGLKWGATPTARIILSETEINRLLAVDNLHERTYQLVTLYLNEIQKYIKWNRQSQWRPKSIPTILKTGAKKLVPVFSIAMVFGCR